MVIYRLLLLIKLAGVLLYAGGLVAAFVATPLVDRRRAVHAVASPGLLLTWTAGYLLTTQLRVPLTELWTLGGLLLSLASHLVLVYSVTRDHARSAGVVLAASAPLLLVLGLMVFRPTWSGSAP